MGSDSLDASRLAATRTIDLTTTGRRTGQPRHIEIWWFHFESRFIITGTPGRRDWLANVRADPEVVIHAAGSDLRATLIEVEDPGFRRRFFTTSATSWYRSQAELEALVEAAPMVEVHFV